MSSTADWSGYFPPPNSRKYIPPKPSKIEGGVGNDADWRPNRKVFSEQTANSTTHILGGPVPVTNPSVVSSCAWETESQSAQQKVKTSQEQLTVSLCPKDIYLMNHNTFYLHIPCIDIFSNLGEVCLSGARQVLRQRMS